MKTKGAIVSETKALRKLLPDFKCNLEDGPVVIRSKCYIGVGCNLRDLDLLQETLANELDVTSCSTLFVAEVSLTYMDTEAANAVIAWASRFDHAQFCLLEQFLPDGEDHPFARVMIERFQKLRCPLRSIHEYPTLEKQRQRFLAAGWTSVHVRDLWSLWQDDSVVRPEQRTSLDNIEPFDEWEEFALFASHYFLLVAKIGAPPGSNQCPTDLADGIEGQRGQDDVQALDFDLDLSFQDTTLKPEPRRYGTMASISPDTVAHHGGVGLQSRLDTSEIYSTAPSETYAPFFSNPQAAARMFHTVTTVGKARSLMVGGRASPDRAFADCWLYETENRSWRRMQDLPTGRYRHCAVNFSIERDLSAADATQLQESVLVFGGKQSRGQVLDEWLLWQADSGWRKLQIMGQGPEARFGAAMSTDTTSSPSGYLLGGIGASGTIFSDFWTWQLYVDQDGPRILCERQHLPGQLVAKLQLARFGATLTLSPWGIFLIGGVAGAGLLKESKEVLDISDVSHISRVNIRRRCERPLLVGCGVFSVNTPNTESVAIFGGGALCFSFGNVWNLGCYILSKERDTPVWNIVSASKELSLATSSVPVRDIEEEVTIPSVITEDVPQPETVRRVTLKSAEQFRHLVERGEPVIMEKLDLGTCTELWKADHLQDRIGADRPVVVHASSSDHMNFQTKNFSYKTMTFGAFLEAVRNKERLYLRAISSTAPAERVTELAQDFPNIADEFRLPPELEYVKANQHSSPLRISGPVTMWLHYDVMANVLCQIQGSKRLLLYPPSDVLLLGFAPGASSSTINAFEADRDSQPSLCLTHPQEAILEPGDVLFIPALWAHTAAPTGGMSIAVNVFFRNLKAGYAAGRDVYGNRDLQAYERGRRDVERIVKAFDGLPTDVGRFYLERLANELDGRAKSFAS